MILRMKFYKFLILSYISAILITGILMFMPGLNFTALVSMIAAAFISIYLRDLTEPLMWGYILIIYPFFAYKIVKAAQSKLKPLPQNPSEPELIDKEQKDITDKYMGWLVIIYLPVILFLQMLIMIAYGASL